MRIESDIKLDFKDVLIRPKRSILKSRLEVELQRDFKFCHSHMVWKGVPIIAANMDHTGTFAMAKVLAAHKMITAIDKFTPLEKWQQFAKDYRHYAPYCFVSAGLNDNDFKQLQAIMMATHFPMICLDVANGYTELFSDFVKKVRDHFPDKIIMAGNVVTGEMTEELILSGTDIVKIGIGPGSVCTTRKKTGVGYPQLSAVIECADAAHGLKGLVCSDGGCTTPGDVAKAFAAGADFVMLGGMFAGHDECRGELVEKDNKKFMRFYGMSSSEAMKKYHGKIASYRAPEGKSVNIPYKGQVVNTALDILGGLRSACTYVGACQLKELSKRSTFIRVTQQLNNIYSQHEITI